MTTPEFVALLADAEAELNARPIFKRFADGTPLSNDIAVWMVEFARKHLIALQAQHDRERDAARERVKRLEKALQHLISAENNLVDAYLKEGCSRVLPTRAIMEADEKVSHAIGLAAAALADDKGTEGKTL